MFQKIEMQTSDGDNKEFEFLANAATPRRFKMVFHKDLLTMFANAKITVDGRDTYDIDFLPELAFIMASQAKAKSDDKFKLDKLNYSMFLDWLEEFDGFAFENKAEEIMNVYLGNAETSSEAKKNIEEQNEN